MSRQPLRTLADSNSLGSKQLVMIFRRDKRICQICFKRCKRKDASRDHIKPLRECTLEEARDMKNMRLAHKWCNQARETLDESVHI